MAGIFTLTITSIASTTSAFGESKASERTELVYLLNQAAQAIGSGKPSAHLIDQGGNDVGNYVFGAGMINAGA